MTNHAIHMLSHPIALRIFFITFITHSLGYSTHVFNKNIMIELCIIAIMWARVGERNCVNLSRLN